MSGGFTTFDLKSAALLIADAVEAAAEELNDADAKLGDGDLGITVSKGWRQIASAIGATPDDVGMAFLKCAQAFQKVSSSSYGTLTATGFMAAARACKGRTEIPWSEVSRLFGDASAAMLARGKSALGDKTVVDALDTIAKATHGLSNGLEIKVAAIAACEATLRNFRDKPNRVGRARMFAEKSVGMDDPGMLALKCVLNAI
jgi:dihydroxyacetone kinase-like protein